MDPCGFAVLYVKTTSYQSPFHNPMENYFYQAMEIVSWDWKPVRGPIGNWFVDLSETGSCPAPKGVVRVSEVGHSRNWFVDLCVNRFVGA